VRIIDYDLRLTHEAKPFSNLFLECGYSGSYDIDLFAGAGEMALGAEVAELL